MKLHSSWLATGMLLFAIFACNTSNDNNRSNSNDHQTNRPANAEVYVDQIQMAKDDNGSVGDSTTSFEPSEHKVHVVITLNKAKAGTQIRVVWLAYNVEGASRNKELKSLDYTTSSFDKKIPGYLEWPQDWPKGEYKVEVYINGVLDKTLSYQVE